jgi:hypothetical protein
VHPDDVAQRVAEEVEILRARLAAAPALHAGQPQLIDRFELRVPFTKVGYRRVFSVPIPMRDRCPKCPPGTELVRMVPVKAYPFRRDLVLRSFCDGYDEQAITADLLLPNGAPLPDPDWPRTLGREAIIRGHEEYDRPFFCRRGLREYHSHPQHEDNAWDAHREAIRIYDVVPELVLDLQTRWDIG